jgi:hypothetical protein
MDVVSPLVANREPAVLRKPGQRALHYPPVSAQLFRTLHTLSGYASLDASLLQGLRTLLVIVGFVGVQLLRTLPRAALPGRLIDSMESKSCAKTVESWTLAALSITASGMPFLSETRWRLEPAFPLSVGFLPVFGPPFWPVCSPSPNRRAPSLAGRPLRAGRATPDGASPTLQLRATP